MVVFKESSCAWVSEALGRTDACRSLSVGSWLGSSSLQYHRPLLPWLQALELEEAAARDILSGAQVVAATCIGCGEPRMQVREGRGEMGGGRGREVGENGDGGCNCMIEGCLLQY